MATQHAKGSLAALPFELTDSILSTLSKQDLLSIRGSCRTLHLAAAPRLANVYEKEQRLGSSSFLTSRRALRTLLDIVRVPEYRMKIRRLAFVSATGLLHVLAAQLERPRSVESAFARQCEFEDAAGDASRLFRQIFKELKDSESLESIRLSIYFGPDIATDLNPWCFGKSHLAEYAIADSQKRGAWNRSHKLIKTSATSSRDLSIPLEALRENYLVGKLQLAVHVSTDPSSNFKENLMIKILEENGATKSVQSVHILDSHHRKMDDQRTQYPSRLLSALANVQELHVTGYLHEKSGMPGCEPSWCKACMEIAPILPSIYVSKITSLSLSQVNVNQAVLSGFLSRHQSTIAVLSLLNLKINFGSWKGILKLASEMPRLETFHAASLRQRPGQGDTLLDCIIREYQIDMEGNEDIQLCLKKTVEKFRLVMPRHRERSCIVLWDGLNVCLRAGHAIAV
ncbi:hypothetical protein EJ04DRAFT_515080 [Polyplosphaeria fusca]|uniref:F-box domain-containing protein n=1 Tax=Polyplosphaeria fusca TaxID=682080 RepID=A0A9P4QTL1_9PLEO|nr:hypothetical protein EJ04DRAFT_515080 [Polyplosphaeria fusca]